MSSKYVATIMNRTFASSGNYLFTCRNVVVGDFDIENNIFTDVNGNDYYYMTSETALSTDIPYSAFNVMEIKDMEEQVNLPDSTMEDKLGEYENLCSGIAYYVGYTYGEEVPFVFAINMEAMKNTATKIKEQQESGEDGIEESPVEKHLTQLTLDAIDDKYTKKELEDIVDKLRDAKEWIENTIATIETKIEAIEANKSFGDYLREKLDEPIGITKSTIPEKVLPKKKPDTKEVKKAKEVPKIETPTIEIKKKDRIDIEEVYNNVTKTLIAQDEAAKRVITEIARKEMDVRKKKEGILLTGPTGVGKTELMRLIAKYIDKPFLKVDTTQITVPGYVGTDIEQVLWDLYVKCGKLKERAEHAIIYFDEIDKKGSEKKNDVNGTGVLNVLLPFIEGSTYNAAPDSKSSSPMVKIDTTNMTVILGGAYTDVYKHLAIKNEIGFGTDKHSIDKPVYRKAETKDFVQYGQMTDEFMGRVTVVRLNDLDVDDIKRIMLESNESAIKIQEEIFAKLGVKITFTDSYLNKVAENAIAKKTGARGLNGIIDESTWKAFEEVYVNEGMYREVVLTDETIEDNSQYKLIKKRKR